MINREIIYVQYGLRNLNLLAESMRIIRNHDKNIPIVLWHDDKTGEKYFQRFKAEPFNIRLISYERKEYDTREANRNNDLMKLIALRRNTADAAAYLDGDIFITDWPAFCDGFDIAQHWGLALPLNSRIFLERELEIAADVSTHDREIMRYEPKHMTAYNMGVIFYSKFGLERTTDFLNSMIIEQAEHPSRGPMAVVRTMIKNGDFVPYTLPLQWLVCAGDEYISHPICLHVGHKEIMKWWEREFKK